MAHKLGSTFTVNVKFQGSFAVGNRVYFPQPASQSQDAMEWDQYETSNVVAAGSNMDLTDGTSSGLATNNNQGPQYVAQMAPPISCRLIGLAVTVDHYNPGNGFTNLRFGVIKTVFDDEDAMSDDAVWTSLGYIDTTTQTGDPAGLCTFNSARFSSSNGDVSAEEGVGFLVETLGGSGGITYGAITAVFRTI